MSAVRPSLPMVLFAVADAIARRGLPDPVSVAAKVRGGEVRLNVDLATVADLEVWAAHCGDAARYIHQTPWDRDGVPHLITATHGRFAGVAVHLSATVPAEDATPDTAPGGTQ